MNPIFTPGGWNEVKCPGPYLGFFVCGGKLGFREISDQYSYKKQPSKIRHYVRKKTFSFPGGGNCPLRPPAMYGPGVSILKRFSRLVVGFDALKNHIGSPCWYVFDFLTNWNDFLVSTKKVTNCADYIPLWVSVQSHLRLLYMFLFYSQSRSNCNVGFWILMEVYYTGELFADAKFPPVSSIAI